MLLPAGAQQQQRQQKQNGSQHEQRQQQDDRQHGLLPEVTLKLASGFAVIVLLHTVQLHKSVRHLLYGESWQEERGHSAEAVLDPTQRGMAVKALALLHAAHVQGTAVQLQSHVVHHNLHCKLTCSALHHSS